MILSCIAESITAAAIAFIVERIIRKTLNYIYNNNNNIHIQYNPQTTQDELVLVLDKEHNKVFKLSHYI